MTDKYRKIGAYECEICGELHDRPSLAEKCYTKCRLYELANEIAELRIRGGVIEGEHEHSKLEVAEIVSSLEDERDRLEGAYGDSCDHGEYMKSVQVDGGVYCHECNEMVNEHPTNPQTLFGG